MTQVKLRRLIDRHWTAISWSFIAAGSVITAIPVIDRFFF